MNSHRFVGLDADGPRPVKAMAGVADVQAGDDPQDDTHRVAEPGAGKDVDVQEAVVQARIGGDAHQPAIELRIADDNEDGAAVQLLAIDPDPRPGADHIDDRCRPGDDVGQGSQSPLAT